MRWSQGSTPHPPSLCWPRPLTHASTPAPLPPLAQVPWSSLGTVPVEVSVDRLYLLASPKADEERGRGVRREVRSFLPSL